MRERQVSLRHADRKRAHTALSQPVDALPALGQELDVCRAVDAPGKHLNLLANWRIGRVERREVAAVLGCAEDGLGQFDSAFAAVTESIVDDGGVSAEVLRELRKEVKLAVG